MNNFKNILSLLCYGVKLGVINLPFLIINTLLLIYSISDIHSLLNNDLVVLIVLLFTNIIWQVISLFFDIAQLLHSTGHYLDNNNSIVNLSPNIQSSYTTFEDPKFNIRVIYSKTSNQILNDNKKISIIKSNRHNKKVERYINQNQGVLLLFLKAKWHNLRNGSFFNETKLCQASEFDEYNNNISIRVCKGCYYNSFITNDIYQQKLRHQDGISLYPPLNAMTAPIEEFDNSTLSNHIGVSMLALTIDGYMIILQHNNKSAISANMYAPSASGSVDYKDWKQLEDSDFRQVLIRAAHREFYEETGFKENLIADTKIIGVYRNIIRGGKPEYCSVAHLNIRKIDALDIFKAEKKEVQDKIETIKVINSSRVLDSTIFDNFLDSHQGLISTSLYMNFFFLRKYMADETTNNNLQKTTTN